MPPKQSEGRVQRATRPVDPWSEFTRMRAGRTPCRARKARRSARRLLLSLDWYEHRGVLVLHQKHEELSRYRGACVAANYMNIIGTFIESLAWRKRDFFPAFHLHHNGALQHVKECMGIVPMNRIRRAGR